MNGADSVVQTLVDCGVEACFANPGTSEIHLVASLNKQKTIRGVLCLHEGVATGAADGYGRMAEKPAMTLLHLGPGLANGLANLHNARRAASPVVNIIGGHASHHNRYAHAALNSDIEGFARPVSAWTLSTASALTAPGDAARAVEAAQRPPGQVATLIVPADAAWTEAVRPAKPLPRPPMASSTAVDAVDAVAAALRRSPRSGLLLRGQALQEQGLAAAGRIAAKTGARILYDTLFPRMQRGAGRVRADRIPYFPEAAMEFMADLEVLVLVGTNPPVSLFGSPDKPSLLAPEGCRIICLAREYEDGVGALEGLAEAVGAPASPGAVTELAVSAPSDDATLAAATIGQAIAYHMPEQAIIVDDSGSSGFASHGGTATARPHDYLFVAGGSIGWGLAAAAGAAVARPDRKVVCLTGDGSGAMAMQALWTQARERLDTVTVVYSNRAYAILDVEWARAGLGNSAPASYFGLDGPAIDWVGLAGAMGVEASRAESTGAFSDQFAAAIRTRGPRLIEAVI
ncbi:MAG: acetolactate synthase large subunit [Devosia sp.]|uniref:acetolactate synthase large subunit n=1 Tax=Devosia sp. TaxID=1871048 RepID=UPI00262A93AF|nr:acetolactate synthase large subunit [Devosia sp.]MDB5539776.1 acetolactate synthase large subunit [Devosia sp.]